MRNVVGGADLTGDGERMADNVENVVQENAGSAIQAQSISGGVNIHFGSSAAEAPRWLRPNSLPPASGTFCNRGPELSAATAAVTTERPVGSPAVVVVTGLRGVGKTRTAIEWATRERERFPDGVVYCDLAGSGRRGLVGLREAVAAILAQFGVSGEHLPSSRDGFLGFYRSFLADRRFLLLLDNARFPNVVEDLLPPSEHSVVFVMTDRDAAALAGRYDGALISLKALSEDFSLELLRSLVGVERVDRDLDGANDLLRVCGRWPQAIRMAAGRLKSRPGLRFAQLTSRLETAYERPRLATEGELAVQVVGDDAYEEMPADLRRAYRLLGLHPGGGDRPTLPAGGRTSRGPAVTFTAGAAAALLGTDEETATGLLDALIDRYLLDEEDGRYHLHDLVRVHARSRLEREEDAAERDAAVRRLAEWYLRSAAIADLAVNPHRPTSGPVYRELRKADSPFGTGDQAVAAGLAWLEAEHRNLRAMVYAADDRGWRDLVWQFCESLWGLYLSLKHYDDWIATHRLGLKAAEELDDPEARFRMGIQLGRALYETRDFPAAHDVLERTLDVAADTVDAGLNQATTLEFIGRAYLDDHQPGKALEYFLRAIALEEAGGRVRGVAIELHHIGRAHLDLGDEGAALEALTKAAEHFVRIGDTYNHGRVLLTLGRLHLRAGRVEPAADALTRSLEIMRKQGKTYQVAAALEALSELADLTGDPSRARALRAEARSAYERVGSLKAVELKAETADPAEGSGTGSA